MLAYSTGAAPEHDDGPGLDGTVGPAVGLVLTVELGLGLGLVLVIGLWVGEAVGRGEAVGLGRQEWPVIEAEAVSATTTVRNAATVTAATMARHPTNRVQRTSGSHITANPQ